MNAQDLGLYPEPLQDSEEASDIANVMAWSPDGRYIASAGMDNTTQVWEALTGRAVHIYRRHTDVVEGVDWSLQEEHVVSGGIDQIAHIWEAFTGKLVAKYI